MKERHGRLTNSETYKVVAIRPSPRSNNRMTGREGVLGQRPANTYRKAIKKSCILIHTHVLNFALYTNNYKSDPYQKYINSYVLFHVKFFITDSQLNSVCVYFAFSGIHL
jgi:hypothetical protein